MPEKKSKRKPSPSTITTALGQLSPADRAEFLVLLEARGMGGGLTNGPASDAVQNKRRPARRTPTYYLVRVDLDGATPPIWRRLTLASDLRLDQVHEVLQTAFDWGGHHLHEFYGDGPRWQAERFLSEFQVDDGEDGTPETEVRLDQVMHSPSDRLHYWYDFGDDWDHTIKLEEVLPRDSHAPLARVVGGRRAAPPDDCGGIPGYEQLLETVADPGHPEHAELCEWFEMDGGVESARSFDPARLDVQALDAAVQEAVG